MSLIPAKLVNIGHPNILGITHFSLTAKSTRNTIYQQIIVGILMAPKEVLGASPPMIRRDGKTALRFVWSVTHIGKPKMGKVAKIMQRRNIAKLTAIITAQDGIKRQWEHFGQMEKEDQRLTVPNVAAVKCVWSMILESTLMKDVLNFTTMANGMYFAPMRQNGGRIQNKGWRRWRVA